MASHDVNSERNEEPTSIASDADSETGGKTVDLRSVEVLVRVFITFVSYAPVDEYLFLVLFTEGIQYYVRSSKMRCSSWKNLISQLREGNPSEPPHLATSGKARDGTGSRGQQCRVNVSEQPSDHTRIWSKLSGSAARSGSGAEARQAERDLNANEQRGIQRISTMRISKDTSAGENVAVDPCLDANCYCLFQYVTFSGLVILRALVS
ncbi:hypothetical protein POTOM_020443 [Populus tomentosa]|uniref:Uncharacterized protein n=1 Tax=Populus tomentosa TaxID=118781 RepID=A0A8X8D0I7_POPTO|nr:hypothetical protein POTOM_020443 [Populus tomentosa]